jgi:DNA-binding transcriptional ArsR family regulator
MVEPCAIHEHPDRPRTPATETDVAAAAALFRAMGDPGRLAVLHALTGGEGCVTDLAAELGLDLPLLSQRLRVLRDAGLVAARREGRHVYYRLLDDHVAQLVSNALAHAREPLPQESP